MAFDVFISYSSKDKTAADAACATLESSGIRCWMAPRDIRPGLEYGAAIIEGIDSCHIMVLIFSSNANASLQVHREIERAVSKGLTIVPMRIEETAPTKAMEYYLGAIHWLDALTPPLSRHLQQLAETIKAIQRADPAASASPADTLPKIAPKQASTFSQSTMRSLIGGLVALALLVAGALAIWENTEILSNLFRKPATANQNILLNILRASYDEPLFNDAPSSFNVAMQRPIDLGEITAAIRQDYPREMLFWLFTDSFGLTLKSQTSGYHYSPPDDYGCNSGDPKHRCFSDWVHIANLAGLTVEEKTFPSGGDKSARVFSRLCFDPLLAQRATAAMPPALAAQPPATNEMLLCGGQWDPLLTADIPQPNIFPIPVGPATFTITPRSAQGVFKFLGTLMKVQRQHLMPSPTAYIPLDRDDVTEPPLLMTVHDDIYLITILQNGKGVGDCFVETRFNGNDYCVPNEAATTKRTFSFLTQLIQGRAQ